METITKHDRNIPTLTRQNALVGDALIRALINDINIDPDVGEYILKHSAALLRSGNHIGYMPIKSTLEDSNDVD